jgi:Tol biopolymer transport system component/DNA-binding winged helix-turn-helix (wHTH) protein
VLVFDSFECDLERGEVRREGRPLRLPPQPLRLLLALLERPGEVVTREELRQRLWPADTFVDFEHGLNAAVKRLRTTLGDSADHPRYVETAPQRGYRFRASLTERTSLAPPRATRVRFSHTAWTRAGVAACAAAALWAFALALRRGPASDPPRIASADRLTHTGRVGLKVPEQGVSSLATDGVRLYYTELDPGGRSYVAHVPVTGGEAVRLASPLERPVVLSLAPDGTELLVRDGSDTGAEGALWALSTATGSARRLGTIVARDAAWSPGRRRLAYTSGRDLCLAGADGERPERAATLPGPASWIRFSPDAQWLRFTVTDPDTQKCSLFELELRESTARPLFGPGSEWSASCCGEWTPDGRLFVFAGSSERRADLWALLDGDDAADRQARVRRLTYGPVAFAAAIPARDGRGLFAIGHDGRYELMKYDPARGLLVARHGLAGAYSRDRRHVAWADRAGTGALWQSRIDGRDRVQIAPAGTEVLMAPEWAPDGARVAFAGRRAGQPWKIQLAATNGRELRTALPGRRPEADPSWSPDGRALMFGRPPDSLGEPGARKEIHILDLEADRVTALPGSAGRFSPRWSPDGRHVAALSLRTRELSVFRFATGAWERVARGPAHNPRWSADGSSLYFQAEEEEYRPVYRVSLEGRRLERVVSPADLARSCWFIGLDLDDAPLLSCGLAGADLYSLDWEPSQ